MTTGRNGSFALIRFECLNARKEYITEYSQKAKIVCLREISVFIRKLTFTKMEKSSGSCPEQPFSTDEPENIFILQNILATLPKILVIGAIPDRKTRDSTLQRDREQCERPALHQNWPVQQL